MIPQTAAALLAFLFLVAPGIVFEDLRERQRPTFDQTNISGNQSPRPGQLVLQRPVAGAARRGTRSSARDHAGSHAPGSELGAGMDRTWPLAEVDELVGGLLDP